MELDGPIFHLKVVLVGDSNVGKTEYFNRLIYNKFEANTFPTIGAFSYQKTFQVEEKNVITSIWDAPGQERFRSFLSMYFRKANGIILFYDVSFFSSFQSLPNWIHLFRKSVDDNAVVMLIGNKCDLPREVITEEGIEFCFEHNLLFFEASPRESINVDKSFCFLLREILQKMSTNLVINVQNNSKGGSNNKNANNKNANNELANPNISTKQNWINKLKNKWRNKESNNKETMSENNNIQRNENKNETQYNENKTETQNIEIDKMIIEELIKEVEKLNLDNQQLKRDYLELERKYTKSQNNLQKYEENNRNRIWESDSTLKNSLIDINNYEQKSY